MNEGETGTPDGIAPYLLLRVNPAARPAASTRHHDALDDVRAARRERAGMRQEILDRLYDLAALVSEPDRRGVVLPASRAVFNDRAPRAGRDELTRVGAPPDLLRWLDLYEREQTVLAGLDETVEQALAEDRERLRSVLGCPDFLSASGLSSTTLARTAHRYAGTAVDSLTKSLRKKEPKLLRYAERATCRTSPFSHYTVVGFGRWADRRSSGAVDLADRSTRVAANLTVAHRLLDLTMTATDLAESVPFRLADGVRTGPDAYRFVAFRDDPVRARMYLADCNEVAVPRTAAVDAVVSLVDGQPDGVPLGALAHTLATAPATPLPLASTLAYVRKLATAGLLVPCLRLDDHAADPVGDLVDALGACGGESASWLAKRLAEIHDHTTALATARPDERPDVVDEIDRCWQQAFTDLGGTPPAGGTTYEDVVFSDPLTVDASAWTAVHRDLVRLLPALEPLNLGHLGDRVLTRGVVDRIGSGGRCAYHEFVAMLPEIFPPGSFRVGAMLDALGGRDPELLELVELRERWVRTVADGRGLDEIEIPDRLLRDMVDGTPERFDRPSASLAALVQPVRTRGGRIERAVVNTMLDGHGQFVSRFLDLWPDDATATVRGHVRSTLPAEATEFRPVQGFNANVHPALLEHGFRVPDQPTAGLDPHTLVVAHDAATDRLVLLRPDGTPVLPVYVGFLVPFFLPWELTGLYLLGDAGLVRQDAVTELERRAGPEERRSLRRYPRVRYGSVILSRRRWYLPTDLLPAQRGDESTAAFLARLDGWRAEHGIPQRVFLMHTDGLEADPSDVDVARQGAGRPKPSYVDLRSPLHVRCLPAWVREAGALCLEEAMPDPEDTESDPHVGGAVREYLVECFRPEARRTS